jgi:hypothetical protein
MTPEDILRRMNELDDQLASKLKHIGFTDWEVRRQLDHAIPPDQRSEEAAAILRREWAKQAADPHSAVSRAVVAAAVRRRRRLRIAIAVALILASVAGAIAYLATREATSKPSPCLAELGAIDRIQQATPTKLYAGGPIDLHDGCSIEVGFIDGRQDRAAVALQDLPARDYRDFESINAAKPFTGHETFTSGHYQVDFYSANAPTWSDEKFDAELHARVGRSQDPMGDTLEASPPTHHTALIRKGDHFVQLELANHLFSDAKAKQLVTEIVGTWP